MPTAQPIQLQVEFGDSLGDELGVEIDEIGGGAVAAVKAGGGEVSLVAGKDADEGERYLEGELELDSFGMVAASRTYRFFR